MTSPTAAKSKSLSTCRGCLSSSVRMTLFPKLLCGADTISGMHEPTRQHLERELALHGVALVEQVDENLVRSYSANGCQLRTTALTVLTQPTSQVRWLADGRAESNSKLYKYLTLQHFTLGSTRQYPTGTEMSGTCTTLSLVGFMAGNNGYAWVDGDKKP